MNLKTQKNKFILAAAIVILAVLALFLYRHFNQKVMECPFSTLTFDSSLEDMTELEGDDYSTYDSIYGGLSYSYDKVYNERPGRIKYMYDDKEKLVNIAWSYSAESSDDLNELYDEIYNEIKSYYGECDSKPEGINNFGGVWRKKSGDILLTIMNTDENKALQFSFRSPEISKK